MNNIFKNACFGKAYRTSDDRKAVYIHHYKDSESDDMHYLIIEGSVVTYVWRADGKIAPNYNNDGLDIVSEWQESIDEEELDRVAYEVDNPFNPFGDSEQCFKYYAFHLGVKAGYRKAIENKL